MKYKSKTLNKTISSSLAIFILLSIFTLQGNAVVDSTPEGTSLKPVVTETGKLYVSVDGLGTTGSGTIQVEKPEGATVRGAYLAATGTGEQVPDGSVLINGAPVTWDRTVVSSGSFIFHNHWSDVTSIVKPVVDAASAGRVDITITENNPSACEGETLIVVFDDPNQVKDNTVMLLFGAQNPTGDTFNIRLAQAINKEDPDLMIRMGLGISFGYQPAGQYSIVDVNDQRLTTSAGGQDDGIGANGALITVGGLDDNPENPADPYGDATDMRTDDELYNLLPFVNNGDTNIKVFSQNPSNDDNIFFGYFFLKSTTATITSGSNTSIEPSLPDYTIDKTVTDVAEKGSDATATKAGDVIQYQISVSNTGNVDLTGVTVTDSLTSSLPGPTGDDYPTGILNAGETWVYTPIYTVTQEDLNNKGGGDGIIDNTATVDCNELDAKTSSASIILDYNPAYSMNKSISDVAGKGPEANVTVAGNVITYRIDVTNDGNIDLTTVNFNDPLLSSPQLSESKTADQILEPGEKWTYTGTYTVVQDDISDNGNGEGIINNTATVDCDQLDSISDNEGAQIDQTPYLVNKTVIDVSGKGPEANVTKAGDVITYQINVTNYGGLPFKLVSVYDSLSMNTFTGPMESGISNKILDPGENWFYTGTYTVNQSDLNTNGGGDGFVDNMATVYFYGGVKPDDGFVGSNSSSAAIPVEQNPAYSINKTVTDVAGKGLEANATKAGDVISYRINVSNTGNLDLTNVSVYDPLISLSNPEESLAVDGILNPGENWIYSGNYTVTQEDIDDNGNYDGEGEKGIIINTATVDCDQLEAISDNAEVQIDQTPYLVNKTVIDVGGKGSSANATTAGDIITYQIKLTNYGGLPFKPVSVHDSLIPLTGPVESNIANKILDPQENWTFTGTYTITQADLNNNGGGDGFINNNATAFFYGGVKKSEKDLAGTRSSSAEVRVEQNPDYSINKTVVDVGGKGPVASASVPGDIISYQINVTNTGNLDLRDVTVSDSLVELKEPSESLTADKILNPKESWVYNLSYTITQEDLNTRGGEDGFINNTATVDCDLLDPMNDSAEVYLEWNPVYSINKTVVDISGKGVSANATAAGDVITYRINVTNEGNIDLTNVNVSDSLISLEEPVGDRKPIGVLNAGENWNYTATYTVTQEDLNSNGDGDSFINNTAGIVCDQLELKSSTAAVQVEQNPAYNVSKIITDVAGKGPEASVTKVGDTITYQVNVSNDGNIDLTNLNVSDSLVTLEDPVGDDEDAGILNVGENWIYTTTYTVTEEDMNSNGGGDKFINNTVNIACDQLDQENDIAAVPIEQNPAYTINKTVADVGGKGPDAKATKAGDIINYQFNVTNDGNIGLNNVSVFDSLVELSERSESKILNGLLELGEIWTYFGNYTVTQSDLNSNGGGDGFVNNTASVDSDELDQENDSAEVPVEQNPAYSINKTVVNVAGKGPEASATFAGDRISYQVNVTNNGNIDLTGVSVSDPLISLEEPTESKNSDGILEVDETWTYLGNYTVTQADLNSNGEEDGFINNTAVADCDQLDQINDTAEVPVEQKPAYGIEKIAIDVAGRGPEGTVTSAGNLITYQIDVTNNGNIDLNNVNVTDSLISLTGPVESNKQYAVTQSMESFEISQQNWDGTLEVGETWTYTGNYTVTQADMNSNGDGDGFINNTASADCDELDPINDSAEVPVEQNFDYSLYKSIIGVDNAGDGIVDRAGDVIEYRIVVKNEGNVDLAGVSVNDPLIQLTKSAGDDTDPEVLNVGESWKFDGNYTVTQDDINCNCGGDGFIDNTATVSCSELQDESSSVEQPIVQKKSLVISKSLLGVDNAGDGIVNRAGDIIEYQIAVKNNGKVDLTGVSVSDPLLQLTGPVGDDEVCPGILNVGETWKFYGNYTVTQEDLDNNGDGDGDIDNTATVSCTKLSDKTSSISVPIILPRTIGSGIDSDSNDSDEDNENSGNDNGTGDGGSNSGSSSGSSGGSSGGAGLSPEPAKNVEVKEISQAFVTSGNSVKFDFPRNATSVTSITFDAKKTAGKTTTVVEMLKGKSTLVSEAPSGEVYKHLNIWVGNSGFAVSKNIENAVIGFRVEKAWLQDKGTDSSSIFLNRYSDHKWNKLPASMSGEDEKYVYFTAETPGFSPFAITAKTTTTGETSNGIKSESSTEGLQENAENSEITETDIDLQAESEGNTSTSEKTPGFEVIYGINGLLAVFLCRRK